MVLISIMALSMVAMLVASHVLLGLHTDEEAAIATHLYQIRNRWVMHAGANYLAYRVMNTGGTCKTSTEWRDALIGPDGGVGFFHDIGNDIANVETYNTVDVGTGVMQAGLNWTYPGFVSDPTLYQIKLYYRLSNVNQDFRLEVLSSAFGVIDQTLTPIVNTAKQVSMGAAYEFSITDALGYIFTKRETIWPYP